MANMLDWNTLDHKAKDDLDTENGIDTPQKAYPILMVALPGTFTEPLGSSLSP